MGRATFAMRWRLALAAALALSLAVACDVPAPEVSEGSSSIVATSSTTLPAGYTTFTDSAYHFSIAVPVSWTMINPTSPATAQALQGVDKANPKLKGVLATGTLADNGVKFIAEDYEGEILPVAGVTVLVWTVLTPEDNNLGRILGPSWRSQYQRIGETITASSTIYLDGYQAYKVEGRVPIRAASGSTTIIDQTEILFAAHHLLFTVTFSGASPALATIESTIRVH